jgi:hypothetical protein
MDEYIGDLHEDVVRRRREIVAAADTGGREANAQLSLPSRTPAREADAAALIVIDQLAARIDAVAMSLIDAVGAEETALWHGRRDPWQAALSNLERFVWLCWALVDLPPAIEPASQARRLVGEFQLEACRIALEVVYLLRGAFYGGALARWRAVYELVVLSEFVWRFGEPAAVRFRDHEARQRSRWSEALKRYGPGWGMTQLTPDQSADIERELARAREAHGEEFAQSDYGWAAPFIDHVGSPDAGMRPPRQGTRSRRRRVRFSDLEEALGLERWRAYNVLASAFVHPRLSTGLDEPGYDSPNIRLALVSPGDGHPGALVALSLSALNQSVLELSADTTDPADVMRVKLVGRAVERLRQDLDRGFTEVEAALSAGAGPDWREADWLKS